MTTVRRHLRRTKSGRVGVRSHYRRVTKRLSYWNRSHGRDMPGKPGKFITIIGDAPPEPVIEPKTKMDIRDLNKLIDERVEKKAKDLGIKIPKWKYRESKADDDSGTESFIRENARRITEEKTGHKMIDNIANNIKESVEQIRVKHNKPTTQPAQEQFEDKVLMPAIKWKNPHAGPVEKIDLDKDSTLKGDVSYDEVFEKLRKQEEEIRRKEHNKREEERLKSKVRQ